MERNIFGGLIAIALLVLFRRRETVVPLLLKNWPILLFFGYCLASTLWSDFPEVSRKRWIKAVGDVVMAMVVLTEKDRTVAVKRFFAWASFLLVPWSILYMEYYPAMGRQFQASVQNYKFIGIASDKNALGTFGLLFALGAIWRVLLAVRKWDIRSLISHGAILAMSLWILRRANSMTSVGAFLLSSVVVVTTSFPVLARKRVIIWPIVITVIIVAAVALFFDAGGGMVQTLGRDPTLTGRRDLWDELLAMNTDPVFGTGFETFWTGSRLQTLWKAHWWHPQEAHNGYLEVFLNLGWTGIVLLVNVLLTALSRGIGALRKEPEIGGLRLTYVVCAIVYSSSEAGFRLLTPVWVSFLVGALGIPRVVQQQRTAVKMPIPQPNRDFRSTTSPRRIPAQAPAVIGRRRA